MPDVRAIRLDGVVAHLKIAARGVVQIFTYRMDPCHASVRRNRRIWLVQVAVNLLIAWHCYRRRAVGKVVDVFRADDVDKLERGLSAITRLRLCLTLIRRLGLRGRNSGC